MPKDDIPEQLRYIPWWRKVDPGPDWTFVIHELDRAARVKLVLSQLEYEKDVAQAATKAIDRNISILSSVKQ